MQHTHTHENQLNVSYNIAKQKIVLVENIAKIAYSRLLNVWRLLRVKEPLIVTLKPTETNWVLYQFSND